MNTNREEFRRSDRLPVRGMGKILPVYSVLILAVVMMLAIPMKARAEENETIHASTSFAAGQLYQPSGADLPAVLVNGTYDGYSDNPSNEVAYGAVHNMPEDMIKTVDSEVFFQRIFQNQNGHPVSLENIQKYCTNAVKVSASDYITRLSGGDVESHNLSWFAENKKVLLVEGNVILSVPGNTVFACPSIIIGNLLRASDSVTIQISRFIYVTGNVSVNNINVANGGALAAAGSLACGTVISTSTEGTADLIMPGHVWSYNSNGAEITATCINGCPDEYDQNGITLKLEGSVSGNYFWDGNGKEITLSGYPETKPSHLAEKPEIKYYYGNKDGSADVSEGNPPLSSPPSDPGNYIAQITWGEKTAGLAFRIILKDMTAKVTGYKGTYDGKAHGIEVSVTEPSAGYTIKYGKTEGTYDLDSSPTYTDAADIPKTIYYQITASGYKTITGSANVEIEKANLTITARDQTYTYNGKEQGESDPVYDDAAEIAKKVIVSGLMPGDEITSIVLEGVGTDAGVYQGEDGINPKNAVITGNDGGNNYNIKYVPGILTINKIPLKITVNGSSSVKNYSGTEQSFTGTVTAACSDPGFDQSKFRYTGSKTVKGTNAGVYSTVLNETSCVYDINLKNYIITWKLGAPVKLTITKADQPAPAAPTASAAAASSVTLKAVNGCEYSMDGRTWQKENAFTGLAKDTEYTFYQRLSADGNHNASPASSAKIRTAKTYGVTYQVTGTVPKGAPAAPKDTNVYETDAEVSVKNALTMKGYTFSGWNTEEVEIKDGKFVMPAKDVTLTGSWTKNAEPETKPETEPETEPEPEPEPEKKVSGTLLARMTAKGNKSLVLTWSRVKGAEGYDIFFTGCGTTLKNKVVRKIKGNKTFTWTKKKLSKGKKYKAYVKAWVKKDGKKTYVKKSPSVHAFTANGNKKYTNPKSVTVKKKQITLKAGKSYTIKAKINKIEKKKSLMKVTHGAALRYCSSNTKIAKVSSKGKITAKAPGKCKVYVYAINGVRKTIKVTVKAN